MARASGTSRSRSELVSFPRRNWVARGALALGLLVLAYQGTVGSLANAVAKVDPARAAALAPDSGVVLARYAQDSFARAPSKDPQSLPARLARRALLADATAADALTVLGFQARLRGDKALADEVFGYSLALSRRELRPRLWAIEEAVEKGDIAAALRNYDIALRTSRDAAGMLYPTLGAALSEPRIRAELIRILATKPAWTEEFAEYVARRGIEPVGFIALLAEGRSLGLNVPDELRAHVVNALVSQDKPDQAWAFYRSYRDNVQRDRSRDPAFTYGGAVRAAFDWQTAVDTRLSVAILSEGKKGLLDFSVPPNSSGELVRQYQVLPKGEYRLHGRSRGLVQPENSRPFWVLSCADGRELGRVVVSDSRTNDGRFAGRFTVPQECRVQILSLMARPNEDIMGMAGQIERVELLPAGGAD